MGKDQSKTGIYSCKIVTNDIHDFCKSVVSKGAKGARVPPALVSRGQSFGGGMSGN